MNIGGEQIIYQPLRNPWEVDDANSFYDFTPADPGSFVNNPIIDQYPEISFECKRNLYSIAPQVNLPYIYTDVNRSIAYEDRAADAEYMLPLTVQAVSAYISCGGHFGFATGYTTDEILHYLGSGYGQIQANLPMITFNGAVIFIPHYNIDGELVEQDILDIRPIEQDAVDLFIETARYTEGVLGIVIYGARHTVVDYPENIPSYLERTFVRNPIADPNLELPEEDQIVKISAVISDAVAHDHSQERQEIQDYLREYAVHSSALLIPRGQSVDLVGRNAVKEEAVNLVARYNDFDRSEIVFLGEGRNDIGALRQAGYALVTGSCIHEACIIADEIIGTHFTDDFAWWLIENALTDSCSQAYLPSY